MKQFVLTVLLIFAVATGIAAQSSAPKPKEKSEVEMLMRRASKIKSPQINYAYISLNMFKQMLHPMLAENPMVSELFGTMKSLRRFFTTGPDGEKQLAAVLHPFMQEEVVVMGMELMTINRENDAMSVIYAGDDKILLINDSGECLSVVFVVGLSYEVFKYIFGESDFEFDF
ncbi:MAG: hypothetical protein IJZ22_03445 [Bacteroidaceae bacterium]|nr:hypothetical protein [Bacteroidaceae bacterium]